MKNNQKGFGVIEGLLIAILICLVSFIGYYVWNINQKTIPSSNLSAPSSTAVSSDTPNLKEYCSAHEKACFKYPASWKVTESCTDTDCNYSDAVTLTTPHGSSVSYTSSVAGIGGGCEQGVTPNFEYTKVEKLGSATELYLVEATRSDITTTTLGLSGDINGQKPKTGDTGSCMNYFAFKAKNTDSASVSLQGHVENSAKDADLNDVEAAILSFRYQ